jgi:hypothetical protein
MGRSTTTTGSRQVKLHKYSAGTFSALANRSQLRLSVQIPQVCLQVMFTIIFKINQSWYTPPVWDPPTVCLPLNISSLGTTQYSKMSLNLLLGKVELCKILIVLYIPYILSGTASANNNSLCVYIF